jgi:hypothetical protein
MKEVKMHKQTAVEWLVDYVHSDEYQNAFGQTYISIAIVEQALDIEKLQIIKAYRDGRTDQQSGIDKWKNRSSSSYYNETYGSNPKTSDN